MKKLLTLTLLLLLVGALLSGCMTDETNARRVLEQNGYTNITFTGYSWLLCGKGDDYATGFIASSPNGSRVEGAVCAGVFKGSTIRFK